MTFHPLQQPKKVDTAPKKPNRSVLDFEDTEEALLRALRKSVLANNGDAPPEKRGAPPKPCRKASIDFQQVFFHERTSKHTNSICRTDSTGSLSDISQTEVSFAAGYDDSTSLCWDDDADLDADKYDWVTPGTRLLPNSEEIYHFQTLGQELKRLQNLRSYHILQSSHEKNVKTLLNKNLDRITGLASRIFDTPIALVSLVDMGRQWFLSNTGTLDGKASETARNISFCTHTIQTKLDIFEVRDASEDIRFKNNPLVTGFPHIRFYAGAPLTSPEGHRLGSLCVISPLPRPEGLRPEEKLSLRDLADMVVHEITCHRSSINGTASPYAASKLPQYCATNEGQHSCSLEKLVKKSQASAKCA